MTVDQCVPIVVQLHYFI